jgi:hypothetical protein
VTTVKTVKTVIDREDGVKGWVEGSLNELPKGTQQGPETLPFPAEEIAVRRVPTEAKGRGTCFFRLAWEVRTWEARNRPLTHGEKVAAFEAWYRRAVAHLKPEMSREDYLTEYFRKLGKVKYPGGNGGDALRKAVARARALPLPDDERLNGLKPEVRLAAALFRETQRAAGTEPCFVGVESLKDYLQVAHATQASRVRDALEGIGALECVVRSKPRDKTASRHSRPTGAIELGAMAEQRWQRTSELGRPWNPLPAIPARGRVREIHRDGQSVGRR